MKHWTETVERIMWCVWLGTMLGVLLCIVVFLFSCTSPTSVQIETIETKLGTFQLFGLMSPSAARSAINEGVDRGIRQVPRVAQLGRIAWEIYSMPESWDCDCVGYVDLGHKKIYMREGYERVLEHEIQHILAFKLGRSRECVALQDHPGGFDLMCRRIL